MPFEQPQLEKPLEIGKEQQQEFLQNEIDKNVRTAERLIEIDQERKDHRLNPLFEIDYSRQYIKDLIPHRPPEDQKLTEKDLHRIENQILGLNFEVADQILQPKPKKMAVREDPDSLRKIYAELGRGGQLFTDIQEKRPEDIQTILKHLLVKGRGIPEEKIKPEQLKQLADSIGNARGSLRRKGEALERYFGKR